MSICSGDDTKGALGGGGLAMCFKKWVRIKIKTERFTRPHTAQLMLLENGIHVEALFFFYRMNWGDRIS